MAVFVYQWFAFALLLFSGAPRMEVPATPFHPFYLSVTEVSHNGGDKTLEVSCKLFAEDLEAIIEKNNKVTLDITTGKDEAHFNKFIPPYIASHLNIAVDGKAAALSFVGYEIDEESAYCYFEVKGMSAVKKADITNTILHDFSREQINIVHFTASGKRQSARLVCPAAKTAFSF